MNENTRDVAKAQLGIFWLLADGAAGSLVADSVPLSGAEPYGDCLTYPHGHHDIWTHWQRLGARGLTARGLPLAVMSQEYDAVPRGRIVFDSLERRFIIYADRKLFAEPVVARHRAPLRTGAGALAYSSRRALSDATNFGQRHTPLYRRSQR